MGNIFGCDSDHGKAAYLSNNSQWLEITWRSPAELVVRYDENAHVYGKIEKYKGIRIVYEPVVPPKGTR